MDKKDNAGMDIDLFDMELADAIADAANVDAPLEGIETKGTRKEEAAAEEDTLRKAKGPALADTKGKAKGKSAPKTLAEVKPAPVLSSAPDAAVEAKEPENAGAPAFEIPVPVAPEVKPKPSAPAEKVSSRTACVVGSKRTGFMLAPDECVVDEYKPMANGSVVLTNRRILISAKYRTELNVKDVAGVSSVNGRYFSKAKLVLGILFVLIFVAAMAFVFVPQLKTMFMGWIAGINWLIYVAIAVGVILGIVGIILLAKCSYREFSINILTENVQQAVCYRSSMDHRDMDIYSTVAGALPGPDYKRFVSEIGARIQEVKLGLWEGK